jgi:hypothetical protein
MKKLFILSGIILSFTFAVFAQQNNSGEKTKNRSGVRENKALKIIEIPKPKYPSQENGAISVRGIVRVKVQFLANGKIGEVVPVTRLGYGLTESAITAAKEIKFEPEIKNGKAVTVIKVIPFNFSIY